MQDTLNKNDIIQFFDRLAPRWDEGGTPSREIVRIILDNTGVAPGKRVLDAACGTGVMIPFYLDRSAASVTGCDLSPKMADIARQKFPQENVRIICGDVEETDFGEKFDCIVVYNALPHFNDPARLIGRLSALLNPAGILTVAHGACRAEINSHHQTHAAGVSRELMDANELADIFARTLHVKNLISDDRMYLVSGHLRA